MDNGNLVDIAVGAVFLLFTGTESLTIDSQILEIISKFGVIAVLWFWLRDMRSQIRVMSKSFEAETKEIREDHERQVRLLLDQQKEFNERIDKILKSNKNEKN